MQNFLILLLTIIFVPVIIAFWLIGAILEIAAWVIVSALMIPFWLYAALTGTAQRIAGPWNLKSVKNPKDWAVWGRFKKPGNRTYKAKEDK